MKRVSAIAVALLLACGVGGFTQEVEPGVTLMLNVGTSVGFSGYSLVQKGYEDQTPEVDETTEHLPGFLLNSVQAGIGSRVMPQVFVAFVPGIWFDESFSRFAFTPASLLLHYSLLEGPVSPMLGVQGGIFIEQPVSAFGIFANPTVGVQGNVPEGPSWYVTIGYLFTSWTLEDDFVDTTNQLYVQLDEDRRHSVSISTGIYF